MSKALHLKLLAARTEGADMRAVLSDLLHRKCNDDGRVCSIAFIAWVTATIVFLIAVAAMIFGESARGIPVLSALSRMPDAHLQTIAASCGIVSSVLFMTFLRLRQEQTKHTFLLVLVLDGNVREAAALLFGGGRATKGEMMADAAGAVLDNLM
jgi:hypothetical protein